MNTVLVHIGRPNAPAGIAPPDYLEDCVNQYSVFNDDKIYVLTNQENIAGLQSYPQVIPVVIEDYSSDKTSHLIALYGRDASDFWTTLLLRFVYIENFLREANLHHVCHFENDVLIYFNIEEYSYVFKQAYKNLAITPGSPDHSFTGFMYIDNYSSMEYMTNFFIETLTKFGVKDTKRQLGFDMVNDMTLMSLFSIAKGPDYMGNLPILPFGEFSGNFDRFKAIFDPASWGQFVGGTRTAIPGAKSQAHYIGRILLANPQYNVEWKVQDGLRLPYFNYDGKLVKINNLHIHSKNLKAFASRGVL